MPLFGLFLMTLVLIVYRSWRTLAAIILTLGALVAIAMGLAYLIGWSYNVDSYSRPTDGHGYDHRDARLHSIAVYGAG